MDSIRQAKEELGQAPVPTTTLETNKIAKFMPKNCQTTLLLSLPSAHNAQC